jgi:Asp-tRNA(Asn)/Glu-tRNA(Gln) amidotransferase A subunit family amidase
LDLVENLTMDAVVEPNTAPQGEAGPTHAGNSLAEWSASAFLRGFAEGRVSAEEYVSACLDRIERYEPDLHAWHVIDPDLVLNRARALDAGIAGGKAIRRLTGVPVGVKDIFNTYDYPTGMGSELMDGYTPGNDARVVSDVRLESGIVMGKTVTAEFAVHHPGQTVHPLDPRRSPGTSSSGSAVAVATRMVPIALCNQTAGSIIRPASYCGVAGFKPSFGLLPRTGILKTTDTLDTVGFMARTAEDLRLIFDVCRVRGRNYPVSEAAMNDPERQSNSGRRWRVGIVKGPKTDFETPEARQGLGAVVDRLAAAGCDVFEYRLPAEFETAHDVHERIYRRALAYYFDLEWNANAGLFSQTMQAMVEGGRAIDPAIYQADIATQRDLARLIDREATGLDVLIGLSTAGEAPMGLDGTDLPDHCLIWTMCGMPAISLPLIRGRDGLPVGIQIVSRRYSDYLLLEFADLVSCIATE